MRSPTCLKQGRVPPAQADRIEQVLRFQRIADLLRQEKTRKRQVRSPGGQKHALRHGGPFDRTHSRDQAGLAGAEDRMDISTILFYAPLVPSELRNTKRTIGLARET